jgi:glycosidase
MPSFINQLRALMVVVASIGFIGCTDTGFENDDVQVSQPPTPEPEPEPEPEPAIIPPPLDDNYAAFESRQLKDEIFYFIFVDRFSNGDTSNDNGDPETISNAQLNTFADRGFHGGDLRGVIDKLDYIQGMGVTALWLNPVIMNQNDYHGYGGVDFLKVDPHFGTNDDYRELVQEAHARNMKVYMDIVVNHTADIIFYEEGSSNYRDTSLPPYTPTTSPENANVKNPAFLNDLSNYNNRGSSTFAGESSYLGDFFGLDDLDTTQPDVIEGLIDIYQTWIGEYGVDGFRIDTARHVQFDFWPQFSPAILNYAVEQGKPNFSMFGEVFEQSDIAFVSSFTKAGQLPSVLDFPMYGRVRSVFSGGDNVSSLTDLFNSDDWYNDADSSALDLTNFIGNHDVGRFGHFLEADNASEDEMLPRSMLAHAFMYFGRGVPVVYYGDEQGFTGDGEDTGARADMFPADLAAYQDDNQIGTTATPANDNFDPTHPLYLGLREFAQVYRAHPALRRGQQLAQSVNSKVLALSRVIPNETNEYLVVFNTDSASNGGAVNSLTPNTSFEAIYPANVGNLSSDAAGVVDVTLDGLSFAIYRASDPVPTSSELGVNISSPTAASTVNGNVEVVANVTADSLVRVDFYVQEDGGDRVFLGSDYNAPYRVYWDSRLASAPVTNVTFSATIDNLDGTTEDADNISVGVDNRVFDHVVVNYENGNNRSQALLIGSSGESRGPLPLADGKVTLGLSAEDTGFALYFEYVDGDNFSFDMPVFVDLTTIFASLPTTAEEIEIFVNNSHEVSLSDNFMGGSAPATLATTPDAAAPFGATAIYVRGAMNDWNADSGWQMEYIGNHTYKASNILNQGEYAYKFADEGWAADTNFGGPFGPQGLNSAGDSSNLPIFASAQGIYDFYLHSVPTDAGTINFHQVLFQGAVTFDGPFDQAELYVRGVNGDWSANLDHQLIYQGENIYQVSIGLDAAEQAFKIADATWEVYDFGLEGGGQLTLGEPFVLEPAGTGGDVSFSVDSAGDFLFELDANNTATPSLTVTAQ